MSFGFRLPVRYVDMFLFYRSLKEAHQKCFMMIQPAFVIASEKYNISPNKRAIIMLNDWKGWGYRLNKKSMFLVLVL